jgi:hypothetical protein
MCRCANEKCANEIVGNMRRTWPPILSKIMITLDSCGRHDLADEIEKRTLLGSVSEVYGESGLFLIHIKRTEKEIFEKIKSEYDEYFKQMIAQGMFVGVDY